MHGEHLHPAGRRLRRAGRQAVFALSGRGQVVEELDGPGTGRRHVGHDGLELVEMRAPVRAEQHLDLQTQHSFDIGHDLAERCRQPCSEPT